MAEKDKRFYWLKLKSEFMNGEIVDFLMSQKNGANYVVLYQMLVLKTMNTNGQLCSQLGEMLIPFDPEKIQRECKWFDIDTIRIAMELYSKLGLVYKNSDGILQIANYEDMVGSETYWAQRKRIERKGSAERQVLDNVQDDVQNTLISNIYNLNSNNIYNNKESGVEREKESKHKFGEYQNVFLKDSEFERLKQDYGEEETNKAITFLDEYIEMKGYKAKSHNLALRKWVFNAVKEQEQRERRVQEKESKKDKTIDILQELWEEADKKEKEQNENN